VTRATLLDRIARGRTDLVFELLHLPNAGEALATGAVSALSWFVHYGDVTALKAVREAGFDLAPLDLDRELGNAAFCGHWTVCDFLILHGADPRAILPETGETPLHAALAKAGRPAFHPVVRLLLDHGADPNARTIPGRPTGAFMRDVVTRGESPLHRAAAYADAETIELLLARGADRTLRDAHGASPLTWASEHLRPGRILALLAHGEHRVSEAHVRNLTSDHGAGWGNGMERSLLGEYLPESLPHPD